MGEKRTKVVVGMSGGVDSSVTALLLKQKGFEVIGLFMKNWEGGEACSTVEDYEDVARVCQKLDIPYYSVNFVQEYWEHVFTHFLKEISLGYTPNPDILCNREIKFGFLLEKARLLGADYLATGHYARIECKEKRRLLRGLDPAKDQSYFLYTLKSPLLCNVLFPIGDLHKKQVREIAKEHGLATCDKKDSTGICFIGERNFKQFLSQYIGCQPGSFENLQGEVIGAHEGAAYYTIGQRKGIGIGGAGEAWFVVGKQMERNVVLIEQGAEHPALYADELTATEESWVGKEPSFPLTCTAKIRYRQADQPCVVTREKEGVLNVRFASPQRAITPRQSVVFYQQEVCLGGAIIEKAGPSYYEQKKSLS